MREFVMKPKLKLISESVVAALDRKYPIIERLQSTPSGWIGRDRLFSKDAVDHAEYIDLTGNTIGDDDRRAWSIINKVNHIRENTIFWNKAFEEMWDKFGFKIVNIIRSGKLTPKQQRVMELHLDGHKMVEIQILLRFKNRSDVTRHFHRGAKKILKILKTLPERLVLAKAA